MLTVQRIIRHIMIKCLLTELHDFGVAPLVILVTGTAFRLPGAAQSVIPVPCLDIGSNILVTIQAQRALLALAERAMARIALLLVPGMPFDETAWHHQRLDASRMYIFMHG